MRPLDALNKALGKRTIIELKNGRRYIGVLKAFDIHINVVLENAEEYEND
ncbi:MAG TPA: small nuclear ribonucleoprotein, partial [Candidatus Woesearchaeota archaeon]|nr:small nuclear ribonucleoprotein [Candidatus Woesearchaeota archaeon]